VEGVAPVASTAARLVIWPATAATHAVEVATGGAIAVTGQKNALEKALSYALHAMHLSLYASADIADDFHPGPILA